MNVPAIITIAVLGGSLVSLVALVWWDTREERREARERTECEHWAAIWNDRYSRSPWS